MWYVTGAAHPFRFATSSSIIVTIAYTVQLLISKEIHYTKKKERRQPRVDGDS